MKTFVRYELVQIDFKKDKYRYCYITLNKINKNTLQLTSRSGKLGNKGRTSLLLEVENNDKNLQQALTKAKEAMRKKKKEGYYFKSDVERKLNNLNGNKYMCDNCKDSMSESLYHKINEWGRNEGGWDTDKNCAGYKKVLCIKCQIDSDIYKKRIKNKRE